MPPTFAYPILMLFGLALLALMGLGPGLHLISRQNPRRVSVAFLISPAIGLSLVALVVYPLILNSITLDKIYIPLTIILLILSGVLIFLDARASRDDYRELLSKTNAIYLATFLIVFIALVLPAHIGGNQYRYGQGTVIDVANYWSLTYLVQHVPFNQIFDTAAIQNAVQNYSSLLFALTHPPVRVVVEIPFGWLSLLFNIHIYEFYYYFKILAFIVAFLMGLAVGERVKLPLNYRLVLASILAIGFWAWYVNDIDALSQIFSIPLSLLFCFSWIQAVEEAQRQWVNRERLLFGVSFAALLAYYPEIIPLVVVAIGLYCLKLLFDLPIRDSLRQIAGVGIGLTISILILFPSLSRIISDVLSQSSIATNGSTDQMANFFYRWFYTREMLTERLWGLLYYNSDNTVLFLLVNTIAILLGIVLVTGIVKVVITRSNYMQTVLTSLLVAFWGGALFIYILGRDWVAGKAFAMGAPFAIITLFMFVYQFASDKEIRAVARYAVTALLIVWSLSQFLVPVIRIKNFAADQGFQDYVDVKTVIGDIVPIIHYLQDNSPELLVSRFFPVSQSISAGWEMMLDDIVQHKTMRGLSTLYELAPVEYWQYIDRAPSHLVFDTSANYLQAMGLGTLIPIADTPFQLYAVEPDELDESVYHSNLFDSDRNGAFVTAYLGLRTDGYGNFRTVDNEQGHIRFIAGNEQPIGIMIGYSTLAPASLSITLNEQVLLDEILINPDSVQYVSFCTTMQPGANDLLLNYSDVEDATTSPLRINYFQVMPRSGERLDVGALDDGIEISEGWFAREISNGLNFRWAGEFAKFPVLTCESTDYVLRFSAAPLGTGEEQRVTIDVNGNIIDEITLREGLNDYEVLVPENLLNQDGIQTITLEHENADMPQNDPRALSAMYDWIEFIPTS